MMALTMEAGMADTGTLTRGTHKGYEMPPYRVEATEGAYELRDYGPYIVAEVRVSGERDRAIGQGFRALAGYIFGGNAEGEKVAMTVPVAQSPDGGGDWTVSFMMPASFTLATLPAPKDGRIKLVEHKAERVAVVTFTGLRGDGALAAREADLRRWVAGRGLTVVAGPHYWFYDGPMTLPWNRRNEVALTVR
jgi:hypothetical protein